MLAIVLASLAAGPFVAGATAEGRQGREPGVRVRWTRNPDPHALPGASVSPICNSEHQCVIAFTSPRALLGGDLVGDVLGGAAAAPLTQGAPGGAAAIGLATLTDSPCGAGSLVLAAVIVSDPASGATGRWEIVPGTGTGGLVNARGSGVVTLGPDGSTADYRGRISCDPSSPA